MPFSGPRFQMEQEKDQTKTGQIIHYSLLVLKEEDKKTFSQVEHRHDYKETHVLVVHGLGSNFRDRMRKVWPKDAGMKRWITFPSAFRSDFRSMELITLWFCGTRGVIW